MRNVDDTITVKQNMFVTYNRLGQVVSFDGIPSDIDVVNVTMSSPGPEAYVWGLGSTPRLRKFLIDPKIAYEKRHYK